MYWHQIVKPNEFHKFDLLVLLSLRTQTYKTTKTKQKKKTKKSIKQIICTSVKLRIKYLRNINTFTNKNIISSKLHEKQKQRLITVSTNYKL